MITIVPASLGKYYTENRNVRSTGWGYISLVTVYTLMLPKSGSGKYVATLRSSVKTSTVVDPEVNRTPDYPRAVTRLK